jgi:hypothetical protein
MIMANSKNNKPDEKPFVSTYKSYKSMTPGEQNAFRQGANTVSNKVKENLGLRKPKETV